jgi:hypothetical protein
MSSLLKKSARQHKRVPTQASCLIQPMNGAQPVIIRLNDLSVAGMSFYHDQNIFKIKTEVRIQFMNVKRQSIIAHGWIATAVADKGAPIRYSIQFRKPLTEENFSALLMAMPLLRRTA